MHSTDDMNDGYIGSGKRLWNSIEYHGRDTHVCEIVEYVVDRETLILREKEIVNDQLLSDPMCMNLVPGGEGGHGWEAANARATPEMIRRRTSMGAVAKNKKHYAELRLLKERDPDTYAVMMKSVGERLTAGRKRAEEDGRIVPGRHWRGRTHSIGTLEKMKVAHRGKTVGTANGSYGSKWIHHPVSYEVKRVCGKEVDAYIRKGWKIGRKIISDGVLL